MLDFPWLIGSVLLLPYDFVPKDFDKCNGQLVPIGNGELFKLIGTRYGGDGKTDFGLPDLRDQAPIEGLTYCIAIQGSLT
jgi:microcystin-dependent protein